MLSLSKLFKPVQRTVLLSFGNLTNPLDATCVSKLGAPVQRGL